MNNFNEYSYLCHYGILGMKWGVRRYQNPDGSLTSAGKQRYSTTTNIAKTASRVASASTFGPGLALKGAYAMTRANQKGLMTVKRAGESVTPIPVTNIERRLFENAKTLSEQTGSGASLIFQQIENADEALNMESLSKADLNTILKVKENAIEARKKYKQEYDAFKNKPIHSKADALQQETMLKELTKKIQKCERYIVACNKYLPEARKREAEKNQNYKLKPPTKTEKTIWAIDKKLSVGPKTVNRRSLLPGSPTGAGKKR